MSSEPLFRCKHMTLKLSQNQAESASVAFVQICAKNFASLDRKIGCRASLDDYFGVHGA